MQNRQVQKIIFKKLSFLFCIFFLMTGCEKEYSFEGGGSRIIRDTIPVPVITNPVCPACINNTAPGLSEWNFKSLNWKLCGRADTAIALGNRTAFTFFGPSTYSSDTGLVITVYLDNDTLNRDKQNLHIDRVAFYCYDRVTPSYIFMSQNSNTFSVTIENYHHATGIATGTFGGTVFRANGAAASIDSGRFKVKLL
jgi:hypothetical protein